MPTFLGLDCGGSNTRALLVDEQGQTLFTGRGGPANLATTPAATLLDSLLTALEQCPVPDFAVGCFAGLLTPADRERALQLLESTSGAKRAEAYPDFEAALIIAEASCHGLVIAGTGALVASHRDGKTWKTGGGGYLLGDQGSVFSMAAKAIYLTLITAERMDASDAFWRRIDDLFGSREPNSVLSSLYKRPTPARDLAGLGSAVIDDYRDGWIYAKHAVERPLENLAEEVAAHFALLHSDQETIRLALAGGLWSICGSVRPVFEQMVQAAADNRGQSYSFEALTGEPVEGAVELARRLAKVNAP